MTRVMVRNPESGDGISAERAAELAHERGIEVRDSSRPGEAVAIARDAAAEADQILAAGGDGTVNEVVHGVDRADALDDVELVVVPTGTGNNFAGNLGIDSVDRGFEISELGSARSLDVGMADSSPFVTSCMGGLVAEASEDTPDERKARIGSAAYVLQTLEEFRGYDGRALSVTAGGSEDPVWNGECIVLLVGNARRFMGDGDHADVEDGQLEVVIVEEAPAIDYLADDALDRVFHREASHITQLLTPEISVRTADEAMSFSLDGEVVERSELDVSVRAGVAQFRVGPGYEPSPPPWPPA